MLSQQNKIKHFGTLAQKSLLSVALVCQDEGHDLYHDMINALGFLDTDDASQILTCLLQSGDLTAQSLDLLKRPDFYLLDLSSGQINRCWDSMIDLYTPLKSSLSNVHELNFSFSQELFDNISIQEICCSCKRLEILKLSSLDFLKDSTVNALLIANTATLRYLDLSDCERITDDAFLCLELSGEASSSALQSLNVARILSLTPLTLEYLSSGNVGNSLEFLGLDGCVCISDIPPSCEFQRLSRLQAKGLRLVRAQAWCHLFENSGSQLVEETRGGWCQYTMLHLNECVVDTHVISTLLPPCMRSIDLGASDGASEGGVVVLERQRLRDLPSNGCTLQEVDLSWCEMLLPHLAIALACSCMDNLVRLNLRCVALDNVSVWPSLFADVDNRIYERPESYHFSANRNCSDHEVKDEMSGGVLNNVHGKNENSVLRTLGECCPNLTDLNVSRCGDTIANLQSIQGFASGVNSKLRKLDIAWSNMNDESLVQLIRHCPNINSLGLQGCKALTPHAADLLAKCELLRWVDLSWVNSMDTDTVEVLVKKNCRLVAVDYYNENIKGVMSHIHADELL